MTNLVFPSMLFLWWLLMQLTWIFCPWKLNGFFVFYMPLIAIMNYSFVVEKAARNCLMRILGDHEYRELASLCFVFDGMWRYWQYKWNSDYEGLYIYFLMKVKNELQYVLSSYEIWGGLSMFLFEMKWVHVMMKIVSKNLWVYMVSCYLKCVIDKF